MSNFLNRYKKFIFTITVILSIPLLSLSFWSLLLRFIYPLMKINQGFSTSMGLLNLFSASVFYILFADLGKTIFIIYILLLPILYSCLLYLGVVKNKDKHVKVVWLILSILLFINYIYFISIHKYFSALVPKDNIQYNIVDYPKGLDNLFKTILVNGEGKGELYEIVGWYDSETLVYKKWKGWKYDIFLKIDPIGTEQLLQYSWVAKRSIKFIGKSESLSNITCDYRDCLKDVVADGDAYHVGCINVSVSPDGRKLACVARHIYGPQDIIIFEK